MKFVHMSDLHLDTKFETLSQIDGLPQKRRLEQRKALRRIIEYIKENKIELFLISGDLYEHKYIRKSSIEYVNNLFKEIPETKIFITPGNHDPFITNSFYATTKWNENVHIFKNNIEKIDYKGIHIYGYGFTDFYCSESKIEEIKIQEPNDINILITHGSLDGGADEFREYNPLRESKLKKLGFDYIALGHIHKPYYNEEKNQKIIYPGSPISLGFDELGKHGIIAGEINKKENKIEFIKLDDREFIEEQVDISQFESNEEIIEKIQEIPFKEQNLYKIILVGKRKFIINIEEIMKLNEIENIVKIKDNTETGINIKEISKENNIRGIFVRRMLERQKKEELDEQFIEKAIEIGIESLK